MGNSSSKILRRMERGRAKRKFFLVPNVALTVTLLIEHQGRLFLWQRRLGLLRPLLAGSELSLGSQLLRELQRGASCLCVLEGSAHVRPY